MKQQLLARIDKLDALSKRDRVSLALGLLALAVGVEFMLVQPTQAKRQRIEQSISADSASQSEAQARSAADAAAQLTSAQRHSTEVQARLTALGLKDGAKPGQRESFAAFLSRSLRRADVVLVSTRGLPVEAVNTGAPVDDGVAVAVATPASAAASSADASASLFRHRTELTLEGSVPALTEAIDLLERDFAPLRIERVRLAPRGNSGAVQATLVLTTINQERTWLAL